MDAHVPGEAFELGGVAPELLVGAAAFDEFLQLRLALVFLGQRRVGLGLDEFGDAVALTVGNPHHAADVAQHAFRTQLAVGDDVGNATLAVFFPHVVDDLDTAALAKVDIDVGRADPFRVEESLEQQAEPQRADVGDAHGIGRKRARGRATAGADRDVIVPSPLDEIRGDEEVGCKA